MSGSVVPGRKRCGKTTAVSMVSRALMKLYKPRFN